MAQTRDEERLAGVPLFSGCSTKELRRIARSTLEVEIPAGGTLMRQDQLGREAFVILEGTVVVRRNDQDVAELGPGAVIGELSLLDQTRSTRTATVHAVTHLRALVLDPNEFADLLRDVPSVATKIFSSLAATIGDLDREAYG